MDGEVGSVAHKRYALKDRDIRYCLDKVSRLPDDVVIGTTELRISSAVRRDGKYFPQLRAIALEGPLNLPRIHTGLGD